MTKSVYSSIRTELRVIQTTCNGDNEEFLNMLANLIGKRDDKITQLEDRISYNSWEKNPDRSGGQFTQDEINDAGAWK